MRIYKATPLTHSAIHTHGIYSIYILLILFFRAPQFPLSDFSHPIQHYWKHFFLIRCNMHIIIHTHIFLHSHSFRTRTTTMHAARQFIILWNDETSSKKNSGERVRGKERNLDVRTFPFFAVKFSLLLQNGPGFLFLRDLGWAWFFSREMNINCKFLSIKVGWKIEFWWLKKIYLHSF